MVWHGLCTLQPYSCRVKCIAYTSLWQPSPSEYWRPPDKYWRPTTTCARLAGFASMIGRLHVYRSKRGHLKCAKEGLNSYQCSVTAVWWQWFYTYVLMAMISYTCIRQLFSTGLQLWFDRFKVKSTPLTGNSLLSVCNQQRFSHRSCSCYHHVILVLYLNMNFHCRAARCNN